ncbi:hypothetical protein ABS767_13775 [Sphingomonas sp. ST-64]|uniref:Uncharacterized protein n=1 Tax=Sphingomonas plantiphila TaxID=3163295 RepID=A0ABW8YP10_9SPHN
MALRGGRHGTLDDTFAQRALDDAPLDHGLLDRPPLFDAALGTRFGNVDGAAADHCAATCACT